MNGVGVQGLASTGAERFGSILRYALILSLQEPLVGYL